MQDSDEIKALASKRGGFFIPRASITSADLLAKRKWGMAGISHSGMIYVRLTNGRPREFILLGKHIDGHAIARGILAGF
jgi:hypothetical protein